MPSAGRPLALNSNGYTPGAATPRPAGAATSRATSSVSVADSPAASENESPKLVATAYVASGSASTVLA